MWHVMIKPCHVGGEKQFSRLNTSLVDPLFYILMTCAQNWGVSSGAWLRSKRASDTLKIQKSKEWGKIAESIQKHAKAVGSPSQGWHIGRFEVMHLLVLGAFPAALWAPSYLLKPQVWCEDTPLQGWPSVSCLPWCAPLLLCDSVCQMKLISSAPDPDYMSCSVWCTAGLTQFLYGSPKEQDKAVTFPSHSYRT